ncbi:MULTISPECIES: GNAT family N-acetyltransferase [Bacillaceae]|uniref:GNAT family N-acetyltransferase n=1 Tax=Evansella alkalicola TaxID=745819 RepID=A0ABS6JN77_9BACI|nr:MULTISPECIES: GNAT family N-acetyltransferase [Bacillaceae]MBU9720028.1 GNAT family N-acetyltransferase [Bacillus alkalicola]
MIIRKATIDDWSGISRVHVDCIQSAYKEIFPSEILDNFTYVSREKRWKKDLPNTIKKGTMTYVAQDQTGEIIGFTLGGTMRDPRLRIGYLGEIYGLYVHPKYQKQGIGKKLFTSISHYFTSLEFPSLAVWTFDSHSSEDFFQHLGGKKIYDKKTTIGGKELKENAYGWDI